MSVLLRKNTEKKRTPFLAKVRFYLPVRQKFMMFSLKQCLTLLTSQEHTTPVSHPLIKLSLIFVNKRLNIYRIKLSIYS